MDEPEQPPGLSNPGLSPPGLSHPGLSPPGLSPVGLALARLAPLLRAGAAPDRVTRLVGEIVAGWAEEPEITQAAAQARIEPMWDSLSRDAAELQEQLNDDEAPHTPARIQAEKTLAALHAAVAALGAAHGRV